MSSSSSNPEFSEIPDTPETPTPIRRNGKFSFKDLKKELKDVERLSKDNLDVKSWASDLKLWIHYQHISDPELIFTACILTSTGETREVIQSLEESKHTPDNESDNEEDENRNEFPTLDDVVDAVEVFYGLKEDQQMLVRKLRNLKIRKNEKVKDFNIRYRTLYLKLDKKRRKLISVLDYADSLKNNKYAWRKISMKDNISLTKALALAEKIDRLSDDFDEEYENFHSKNTSKQNLYKGNKNQPNYNRQNGLKQSYFKPNAYYNNPRRNVEFSETKKGNKDSVMDDLTKRMKGLSINACFFCGEEGHYLNNCEKLQSIIKENKEKYLHSQHLNH